MVPILMGIVMINADRTNPAHAVTGHEIVHEIEKIRLFLIHL